MYYEIISELGVESKRISLIPSFSVKDGFWFWNCPGFPSLDLGVETGGFLDVVPSVVRGM